MYNTLEFRYKVEKRFSSKLASWLSGKERRTSSCLSRTYEPPKKDELKQVFDKFDINKDGKICRNDLKQHFASFKNGNMGDRVTKMVEAADFDEDGVINFIDFKELHKKGISEQEIRSAFRMYDLDADGKISAKDLQEVLHRLGEKYSNLECVIMIANADCDGDGKVDVEDFMIMMTKTLKMLP